MISTWMSHNHPSILMCVIDIYVEESLLVPLDTLVLVGIGVGVAGNLARLTAEDAVKVGADLVGTALERDTRSRLALIV